MEMKLCKCPKCGKGGLWSDGYFQQTQCQCPHCGSHINNRQPCTDYKLMKVEQVEPSCEKTCGECKYFNSEAEEGCKLKGWEVWPGTPAEKCFTPKQEQVEQEEPVNNMMFFTTEWAGMVAKHEQQIYELSERIGMMEISDNGFNHLKARVEKLEKETLDLGVTVYDEYGTVLDDVQKGINKLEGK